MEGDQREPESDRRHRHRRESRPRRDPSPEGPRTGQECQTSLRGRDDPQRVAEQRQPGRNPAGHRRSPARRPPMPDRTRDRPQPEGHGGHVGPCRDRREPEGPAEEVETRREGRTATVVEQGPGQPKHQGDGHHPHQCRGQPRRPQALAQHQMHCCLDVEAQGRQGIEQLIGPVVNRPHVPRRDVGDLRDPRAEDRDSRHPIEVLVLSRSETRHQRYLPREERGHQGGQHGRGAMGHRDVFPSREEDSSPRWAQPMSRRSRPPESGHIANDQWTARTPLGQSAPRTDVPSKARLPSSIISLIIAPLCILLPSLDLAC
jgi:hypothetical protein